MSEESGFFLIPEELDLPEEVPEVDAAEVDEFLQHLIECMKHSIEERRIDGETLGSED